MEIATGKILSRDCCSSGFISKDIIFYVFFSVTKEEYNVVITCCRFTFLYQYSEANVMNFLLNLLRIKGLYMFRALFAHPQKALHKRQLVYCVRVMFHFNPGAAN
jgi:hypothetical protein